MKKGGRRRYGPLAAAAATAALALAGPASAAETIRLTMISGNTHHYVPIGAAIKIFMPKVDEILARSGKYKISWIKGFGGQIVKVRGELDGVEAGLGDIGIVPGPFHPSKMSLYQIGYVTPFTSLDLQTTTDGMYVLFDKYPAMGKQMQRFNQSIAGITGTAENYALWSKKKISRYEDLEGMKIGAVGSNFPWVSAAGATPVTIKGLVTMYNELKTGIYEGGVLWQQAIAGFKLCQLTPHHLDVSFGAIANATMTYNDDSWAKLPREVQAAMNEAADVWSRGANKMILGGAKWGLGLCEEKYGQTTHVLSAEEKKKWAFALPNIAKQWAERQDKAGLPGTKMLASWMDFMRDKKQLVLRDWDRE